MFVKLTSSFKKYLINTSWLFLGRIVFMLVALAVNLYVARYLGPQRYGLLSYAISLVSLFAALCSLGLDQIAVRELVKNDSKVESIMGTVFVLKLVGAFLVMGLLATLLSSVNKDPQTKVLVLIIAAGFFLQPFNVIDFFFQAQVASKYVVFAQLYQIMLSSLSKIILIYLKANLFCFALIVVLDGFVFTLGLLYFFHTRNQKNLFKWKFDLLLAVRLLQESWPLALSGLAVTIYMKIDQVMIKEILDPQSVGLYAAAVQISEAGYFVPVLITQSIFPAIIKHKQDNHAYGDIIKKLFIIMSIFSYAIITFFYFFHEIIVKILLGSSYLYAGNILKIHIFALLFVSFGMITNKWLLIEKKTNIILAQTITGMVCNIILNILMIPRFGVIGAAWATVLSYSITSYFFDLCFENMRWLFLSKSYSLFFIKYKGNNS